MPLHSYFGVDRLQRICQRKLWKRPTDIHEIHWNEFIILAWCGRDSGCFAFPAYLDHATYRQPFCKSSVPGKGLSVLSRDSVWASNILQSAFYLSPLSSSFDRSLFSFTLLSNGDELPIAVRIRTPSRHGLAIMPQMDTIWFIQPNLFVLVWELQDISWFPSWYWARSYWVWSLGASLVADASDCPRPIWRVLQETWRDDS